MTPSILVICPYEADLGLISKAVCLAEGDPVRVLIPKGDENAAAEVGAAFIHTLENAPRDENCITKWLAERITHWGSTLLLAPATVQLRNLMPMLAYRLGAGLTADCTALSMDNGQLLQTRPAFGNSLMADIRTCSDIQMATVRPGTFRPVVKKHPSPVITNEILAATETPTVCLDYLPFTDSKPLSQAQIVIAGGSGLGSKEDFKKLEALAKKLGGAVAASRNAVDAGFAPYRCQVGMTGVTLCPKLYIAIGISGAVQHLAGMSGAEKVIAINSDPKAPIFDYADYGIVAEWEPVIDKLLEELS